jgi:hypothetical protein
MDLPVPRPVETTPEFVKVAVLADESEAERLHLELQRQEIPHVMVSYQDAAFSGIFQSAKGWGHVEANADNKDTILSTLEDLRKMQPLATDELPDSS